MAEKEFQLIGAKTSDKGERHCSDLNGRSKKIGERSKRNAPIDRNRLPPCLCDIKNNVLAVCIKPQL